MNKAIRCICFVVLLVVVLHYTTSVFAFKYEDGIYDMTTFYEQEDNTIDVLAIGSSHAYCNINTSVLWEEYGIAAFDLGGSIQPMWNSYHYLIEALKTQSPRLILLEGYTLTLSEEYMDDSRVIKNTYGLHWNHNKLDAIKDSTLPDQRSEFMPEYNQYHGRYTEISEKDFRTNQGNPLYANWKGFQNLTHTNHYESAADVTHVSERLAPTQRSETYYRKILALAQERHIPIAVIITPYAEITERQQMIYNYCADIAAEYNVGFYNYNLEYERIGMDMYTDCAGSDHLNYLGSAKFAKALGNTIIKDYPDCYIDRRGDAAYESWALDSIYYERTISNHAITKVEDIPSAIYLANDENYIVLLSISEMSDDARTLHAALASMGIDMEGDCGVWMMRGGTDAFNRISHDDLPYHMELMKYDDLLIMPSPGNDANGNAITRYQFLLDNKDYSSDNDEATVNLFIYDQSTASVVTTKDL